MTFYSDNEDMTDLMASLRSELPEAYESMPGFHGALVMQQQGARTHVFALTLWDDEESLQASKATADGFADRIADAIGTSVARNVYDVLAHIGIGGEAPSVD